MIPAGQFLIATSPALLLPVHRFTLDLTSKARGGAQLNDAQLGINVQDWDGRVLSDVFYVSSPTHAESSIIPVVGAKTATFAFDRNMQPVVCWNTDTNSKLYFFNSLTDQFETMVLTGIKRAMVFHDDVRDSATARSDVLMVYQKNTGLYYRQQRDRYAVEYLIRSIVAGQLASCGMGVANRLVFKME